MHVSTDYCLLLEVRQVCIGVTQNTRQNKKKAYKKVTKDNLFQPRYSLTRKKSEDIVFETI